MNEELMKDKIATHDNLLKDHDKRLDKIEQDSREFKIEIKNLCENIKSLTSVMKWFCGIWVSSLLGFFFYSIQHNLFK